MTARRGTPFPRARRWDIFFEDGPGCIWSYCKKRFCLTAIICAAALKIDYLGTALFVSQRCIKFCFDSKIFHILPEMDMVRSTAIFSVDPVQRVDLALVGNDWLSYFITRGSINNLQMLTMSRRSLSKHCAECGRFPYSNTLRRRDHTDYWLLLWRKRNAFEQFHQRKDYYSEIQLHG